MPSGDRGSAYWRANLTFVAALLSVWFAVSFGCGILFVDALDRYRLGGFKLGFWFAQQGSIFVFVVLIVIYALGMHWMDRHFGVDERSTSESDTVGASDLESGADR